MPQNESIMRIRNDSGAPYTVEETGAVIPDGGEYDLMADYDNWEAARSLVVSTPTAQLCRDYLEGKIAIVETKRPVVYPIEELIAGGRPGGPR